MTKLLCLEDGYLKECDAHVESVSGKEITLDRTIFYPSGGGQPSDTGKIVTSAGTEYAVVEVSKRDGRIIHTLEREAEAQVGQTVRCILDWERRYRLMRMHTAAHVLGSVMFSDLGALVSGNQLEADKSRFDFTLSGFDRSKFDEAVQKANSHLSRDVLLKVYSLPWGEAMKIPGVVKLAIALPPSISELRIVEIPGIDIQADGGTHVRNLREVGRIEILKLENKGKDNRRIYFSLI